MGSESVFSAGSGGFQGESQERHSASVGFSKTCENLAIVDELLTYWNLDESENILDEIEKVLLMSMCSHSSFSFFNRTLSFALRALFGFSLNLAFVPVNFVIWFWK